MMSSGRSVIFGIEESPSMLEIRRAVAKTCQSRAANSLASEYPMPPLVQPVISTVRLAIV